MKAIAKAWPFTTAMASEPSGLNVTAMAPRLARR